MSTMENSMPQTYAYLPSFPPQKNTKPSYSRFLLSAPLVALADITPHSKKPAQFQLSTSCRVRVQVGNTNRWRIPTELGSDLLGTSQAIRAVTSSIKGKRELISTDDITSRLQSRETSSFRQHRMRNGVKSAPPPSKTERNRYKPNLGPKCRTTLCTAVDLKRERSTSSLVDEPLSLKQIQQMQQCHIYIPPDKRQPTPVEMFLRSVHIASRHNGIDLIINTLNTNWNLHLRYTHESRLLTKIIKEKIETDYFNQYYVEQDSQDDFFVTTSERQGVSVSIPRTPLYPKTIPVFVDLDVKDEIITRHAFASALCFLYDHQYDFDHLDVVNILATAHFLQIDALKDRCANVMIGTIHASNACIFHSAAIKYDVMAVKEHCEKWLEINMVPELTSSMYLGHLSSALLAKLLRSHSLFSLNEYTLFRLVCNWVFLRQHSTLEMLPNWGTVVTSFMSIPSTASFLESDEGQQFQHLFKNLRLNGITDSSHLDEITKMNIFPSEWLLKVFTQHYYSLQGGGDMSLLTRFEEGAVRYGFILNQPDRYYNDLLSLHGFHFEISAEIDDENQCFISMQRLRPSDPIVSQKISDRQTLSIRYDREVRYAIRAQYFDGENFRSEHLGPKVQGFGINNKTEKSEVLKIDVAILPLYVTFSLLFPPS